MHVFVLLLLLLPVTESVQLPPVVDGYVVSAFAEQMRGPRGMVLDSAGNLLVVQASAGSVVKFVGSTRSTLVSAPGLNHGIALSAGFLYASSQTTVYRWPYSVAQSSISAAAQRVVHGIPRGGHLTRTLVFDALGFLYMSVGSAGNVDADSIRSRVMRFSPSQLNTTGGVQWTTGALFADGMRNEVALAFDSTGRLWGVENGVDDLARQDLGGDIHQVRVFFSRPNPTYMSMYTCVYLYT
jgi:glucose/arabinose dehydrogenase